MQLVDKRMIQARTALLTSFTFFGALALYLEIVEDETVDTMATDGKSIFYRSKALDELKFAEIIFIIAHEVAHCALKHHTRRNNRENQLWNIACDYVVNIMLVKAGLTMPDWVLYEIAFDGLTAEEVYRILDQERKAQQQQQQQGGSASGAQQPQSGGTQQQPSGGQPQPSQSSGQPPGQQPSPNPVTLGQQPGQQQGQGQQPDGYRKTGLCGEVRDAVPAGAPTGEVEAEWDTHIRQAVSVAKKQEAGVLPGFLERVVKELQAPHADWREVLRRYYDYGTTYRQSWSNPNRRFIHQGIYLPGTVSDGINHVAILIDVSMSIDVEALSRFQSETQAALDEGAINAVTVVYCDTKVQSTKRFEAGDEIKFVTTGGGGTMFQPALDWVNENADDVSAAIYFTDLCADDRKTLREPSYPVLWAAYGDPRVIQRIQPDFQFGEHVDLGQ